MTATEALVKYTVSVQYSGQTHMDKISSLQEIRLHRHQVDSKFYKRGVIVWSPFWAQAYSYVYETASGSRKQHSPILALSMS